jgi:DNA-binding CsgD family transcriptional regulator
MLTPRQLAAARLLAQGIKPRDVATHLKITRQGLWKWRRDAAFAAEVRRLHELLLTSR